ncbi:MULTISPECIES: hypothetical protein [Pseudomonas]|jgi:hypothetical protein|uniref:Uncharacterized protein n=1 Tax=Pseudomonas paracarnis TaxID=2750625 RepID=A0ABU6BPJ3_9PSED|nr:MULTISPECIES: hypothetical protein [Pseudomonas]KWV74395.1 hypothetical protein PFLuk1_00120 [Pseudomonas fluorescens]MDN5485822.1 hypothetical protein [Pseudomonas sp.]NLT86865.1 hypothetical protein [Pseudomonas lactis]PMZ68495.1 hypothetical protein C1X25_23130 [Pseudomonas sp. GW247-3R2A]AIB43576.1 hypothetical protein PD374_21445 [Pseudomonas sp. WCS374]
MEQSEHASAGWLKSTGFEGEIDTSNVVYRESSPGRWITLDGRQPSQGGDFIGIQIDFPKDQPPGPITVPQPWPKDVNVSYFRQTVFGHRTSYRAKSGTLDLRTYDGNTGSAAGTFEITAEVEGTDRSFKGSFDIRTVKNS